MTNSLRLPLFAGTVLMAAFCAAPILAVPRRGISNPVSESLSPIGYVGGRRPHAVVRFDRIKEGAAPSYTARTPHGTVTVYWRRDDGTEDGGPPFAVGEITHPDSIFQVVVVSPPTLLVDFIGAFGPLGESDVKWVHLNGARVTFKKPTGVLRLGPGLNIVAVGYPDVE